MRQSTSAQIIVVFLFAMCVTFAAAFCAHGVPQTDPTVIAQRGTRVIKVLDVVVDSLNLVRDAGWLPQPVNKTIQDDILTAIPIIVKAPDGARATAIAALTSAQHRVGVTVPAAKWLTWGIVSVEALP